MNRSNTFGKKRLIEKFYEGDYENKNVQVPENNNSSDKKKSLGISDFMMKQLDVLRNKCSKKKKMFFSL